MPALRTERNRAHCYTTSNLPEFAIEWYFTIQNGTAILDLLSSFWRQGRLLPYDRRGGTDIVHFSKNTGLLIRYGLPNGLFCP